VTEDRDRRKALRQERRREKQQRRRKEGAGPGGPVFTKASERGTATFDPIVVARDIRVEFRPYIEHRPTLRKALKPSRRKANTVVALDGVSLTINRGEAFGIVGSNGAGKSTLLKVLSGAMRPDAGSITLYGSSPSLLALGVGFNRQLSGRRNVYLGGMAAGLRKAEIDERFDEVAEYADIGKAIERPVATYSSGQFARLAFSVSMLARPDILLVDELFAVGDEAFRVKSAKTMEQILHDAGTIVMVSHSLGRMQRFCDRVAWLDHGHVMAVGEPKEIIRQYRQHTGVNPEDVEGDDDPDEMFGGDI